MRYKVTNTSRYRQSNLLWLLLPANTHGTLRWINHIHTISGKYPVLKIIEILPPGIIEGHFTSETKALTCSRISRQPPKYLGATLTASGFHMPHSTFTVKLFVQNKACRPIRLADPLPTVLPLTTLSASAESRKRAAHQSRESRRCAFRTPNAVVY